MLLVELKVRLMPHKMTALLASNDTERDSHGCEAYMLYYMHVHLLKATSAIVLHTKAGYTLTRSLLSTVYSNMFHNT